jgi:ubiquinone biosynthesis accessory factor UbiK
MKQPYFLKDLAKELTDALSVHVPVLKKDIEKMCHDTLKQAFNRLDLVTREEFDIQCKVLARTRKKLEELEKKLKEL